MNKLFLTILFGVWMLNANAQDDGDAATSQTIASLLEPQSKEKTKKVDESVAASIGFSSITSKLYTSGDVFTDCKGMDAMVEYDYVYPSGFGLGITIAFNRTKIPYDNTWVKQLFAGPSLVYAGYLGRKWWAKADLGLGYGNCIDEGSISTGLGAKSSVSFDYMVTPTIGIGAQLSTFSTFLGKSKGYGRDGEMDGIVRYGLSINLRKHF